ncbi:hypothetical protein ACFWVG_24550, partial [Streptomyces sp. NPDC058698]
MVRTVVVHDEELLRSALVQLLRSDVALEVSSMSPCADLPDRDVLPTDVWVVDGDCLQGPGQTRGPPQPAPARVPHVRLTAPQPPRLHPPAGEERGTG